VGSAGPSAIFLGMPSKTSPRHYSNLLPPAARNWAPCRACQLCGAPGGSAPRQLPASGPPPAGGHCVGLLQIVFPLFRMTLNHADQVSSGGAFSPCLRAFCDDTALPSAVTGPVARRVTALNLRDRNDVDRPRFWTSRYSADSRRARFSRSGSFSEWRR